MSKENCGERFTGHGLEWKPANLSVADAQLATQWVEQRIDRRSMLTNKDRVEDVRDAMWQLEKDGEIVVHRVTDAHRPVTVKTLYGWDKRIPTTQLWHHKSCGQCGNIPGYPVSLLWLQNKLGTDYLDETDQTSCTAWNYHGSGIGNLESLAAVFLRNFHQAYVSAKAHGGEAGHYYPLVHCGTSFGNYKEVRQYLIHSAKLRESVKKILAKLGRLVDGKLLIPEEVVHYSEWLHVMRAEIAEHQTIDARNIRVTIHPACHVYKMVPEDAIYDDTILEGNRVAVSTGLMQALGAQVIDYKTWYDCCGFGFRHIISEREFTRSFAIDRKIRVAVEEAKADVMIGHDTGCITTLDKNQWISKAGGEDKAVELPVLADCQFAALLCGADPYRIVQTHWHASPIEGLLEKLGIDWRASKLAFEQYLKEIEKGAKADQLYDPRRAITSGPGFKPVRREVILPPPAAE
jgi:heterodisulfide reductase subunit B